MIVLPKYHSYPQIEVGNGFYAQVWDSSSQTKKSHPGRIEFIDPDKGP